METRGIKWVYQSLPSTPAIRIERFGSWPNQRYSALEKSETPSACRWGCFLRVGEWGIKELQVAQDAMLFAALAPQLPSP